MATNKRYYWIKLREDFLNGAVVDFLMSQKNGSQYVVLYLMLCMNTRNNEGKLYSTFGEMIVPFDAEKITRDTKYFDIDTVTVAMSLYKKLGLIYEDTNGCLIISDYDNMVGSETYNAIHMRQKRKTHNNVMPMLADCYVEKETEKEKEEEKEKETEVDKRKTINYQRIADMYNETCVSFPRIRQLSESRKKTIKARLKTYSYEDFEELFKKAEASSFLKGSNSHDWSATFDWLIKDANMAKVLDGNYDDVKTPGEVTETRTQHTDKNLNNELETLINSMK